MKYIQITYRYNIYPHTSSSDTDYEYKPLVVSAVVAALLVVLYYW